jgi:hypothetical protein
MSDYSFISLRREEGTVVKSFKTASRVKSTLVTIEIEVVDPYALGDLLQQLHAAKHPPKPKPAPKPDATQKALPAPLLQLPHHKALDL